MELIAHSTFTMHRTRHTLVTAATCLALALSAGCSNSFKLFKPGDKADASSDPQPNMQPGQMQVLAEGGLSLEARKDKERACGELLTTLDGLLRQQRLTTARRLIDRHPDLSLEILQTAAGSRAKSSSVQFVAQARDGQCGTAATSTGWEALLADRVAQPERYLAYDEARGKLFEAFKLGDSQKAVDLPLVKLATAADNPMLTIDATMLSGTALLFAKRPVEAAAAFQQAFELGRQHDPHQAVHALLLLGNAQRLAGDAAASAQSWQQATTLAAEALARPVPITDPALWERASYLRPAQLNWPDAVERQLQITSGLDYGGQSAEGKPPSGLGEAPLFACLGQWRLARNEPQAALLAFKRADTATADAHLQDQLRLDEAKCLTRLGQTGAATAVLMGMAKKPEPRLSRPALGVIGGIKLQSGQTEFAQKVLQRALEQEPIVDWPQRSEAEADYGLACLMLGDEQAGLRWLHSAQKRFEATGQFELLTKCIWNESRYFEHTGKHKAEAAELDARLRSLETDASSLTGMPDSATSR
jgi:tetratricopeptide (TPR) repeat protein